MNKIPRILQHAQWIWPDSFHWDLSNCYALFRKEFTLPRIPAKAPLIITADQSYQLYVNGTYVCRGPARGFQKSWPYDEVDIRPWLKKGKNLLAVRAHNPGRSNFQYLHQGYAGLLVAAGWQGTRIVSDPSWKCRRQTGVNRNTVPTSQQLFPQEDIDLRQEDPGWMLPGYKESACWEPVEVAACPWNGMPWYDLEPRGIPMLDETILLPASCIGEAEGANAPDYRKARNLAINRFDEGMKHRAVSGPATPLKFAPSVPGGWSSRLIDFGRVVVGSVVLEISGAKGGEVAETFHSETIDPGTLEPHFIKEDHCRMAFAHRLTCRPGRQEHAFYHPFGFRYMVLTVRDNAGPLTVRTSLRTAVYPHRQKGVFCSSDAGLEKIWNACAWTQQICSMDAYVDTPWREQAQWWGDARVQAWNTFHFSGDARLFQRGIKQIAAQTAPSGITYGHAPTMAHTCILPDFSLIWMVTLWDDYWQTGSLKSFTNHQETIQKTLAYFEEWTDSKTGLLKYDARYWLFLDWTDLQKDGCSTVYSLWLLYALDRLASMYRLIKQNKKADFCKKWADSLRRSLLKLLSPAGLLRDGILPNGRINPHCSVHAQTLSLMNRLSPKNEKAMLEKSLLPFLRGRLKSKVQPSAYWITYVYTELAHRGHGAEVLEHIRKRWTPMAEYGSTFENFDPKPGAISQSHAWSAHPLFHLMQILGGIRQTAPAWKEVSFAPCFIGDQARVIIPTPQGKIETYWKRQSDGIKARLSLPGSVTAKVSLPGRKPGVVRRSNDWVLDAV